MRADFLGDGRWYYASKRRRPSKINRLLEAAGWRFFDDKSGPVNVVLEPNVKLKPEHIESRGADFEKSAEGFIDFLLPGDDGKPLIVLEAKSEDKSYSPTCKRIRAF